MAVVGVDFGTLHSKIGVARHRGIDIITNEVSNRATPSLVAFGVKARSIGEAAKTQETSNFKNTIGGLKRLIGRAFGDPEIQETEKKHLNAKLVDVNGSVGVEVRYKGELTTLSITQLVATYFGKIRDITAAELKVTPTDIVISVPVWYTDVQRRAIIDAAAIANLNVLRLINEPTAAALGYGITKSDLPEQGEKSRNVVFVDVGHSSLSVSVVAFNKGQLQVKSTAHDRNLGGRDFDFALVRHFAEEFKTKYKIDVLSTPKAVFRLAVACEKLKKVLSANSEAPINVESIMNDIDASSKLTREELESLVVDELSRVVAPIEQALKESELSLDEIDAIELIGGSTRIPAIKSRIQSVFPGKVLSSTLNQDEAVARGATFACAMLSPVFRVRDFHISDISPYSIKIKWERLPTDAPEDDTELEVFPEGNNVPSTKVLSFYRKDAFELEAVYSNPEKLPGGVNPWVSKFTAKQVPANTKNDQTCVKVKTRLNLHGILSFEQAYVEEVEEREEQMEVDTPPAAEGEEAKAAPKKKRYTKKIDVPFVAGNTSLDSSIVEKWKELEAEMWASDKLVLDTEDRKNALEEYVYDTRGKLEERYAAFVQASEKEQLLAGLQAAEDWLYTEEGEDATKSAYVERLDALKKIGDPVHLRWKETIERPKAIAQLRETLNNFMSQASSEDDKYSHIDTKDKQSVIEKVANIQKWVEDQSIRQMEKPKNVDPILTSEEVMKKRDEVIYFATPILSRPKPKPPVVPTGGSGTQTPKSGTETPAPEAEKKQEQGPSEMDVD